MGYYLKLECKKSRIKKYIWGTAGIILFCLIFLTLSLYDSATDPTQVKDSYESSLVSVSLLVCTIFLIYEAVMMSMVLINEYNNKTILILFTYPVGKKKIIAIKLMIVTGFMVLSMMAAYLICMIYLVIVDHQFDWVEGSYSSALIVPYLKMIISNIISCISLSLLSFAAGMLRKSVPAAVVTSFAALFIRQVLISENRPLFYESIPQLIVLVIVCSILSVLTFRNKTLKIEKI